MAKEVSGYNHTGSEQTFFMAEVKASFLFLSFTCLKAKALEHLPRVYLPMLISDPETKLKMQRKRLT